MKKEKTILITGASGFVGTNLRNYFKGKHEVFPVSVRYLPYQNFNFEVDVIIHLSGKVHDLKSVRNPIDYYEANSELTKQLYDAFLLSKSSLFIYFSSVKAAADKIERILIEGVVPNPITAHGKSKLAAEHYLLAKPIPAGKRVYILRPCMIHGPGNKGNLNLLYQLVSKGLPWPLGAFENQRSFLSVENLCFVIQELLTNKDIASGVYNVADDVPLSTNELIQLLGESLGKQSSIWHLPRPLMTGLAKLGDRLHLPLNSERLHKLTKNYVVSNDKITQAIGKPLPISSKEGLRRTFASFKPLAPKGGI